MSSQKGTIAILTGGGDVPGLNPAIRLLGSSGALLVANDDSYFYGDYLPPESPLPRDKAWAANSEFYHVITAPGTYFIEVSASNQASAGSRLPQAIWR